MDLLVLRKVLEQLLAGAPLTLDGCLDRGRDAVVVRPVGGLHVTGDLRQPLVPVNLTPEARARGGPYRFSCEGLGRRDKAPHVLRERGRISPESRPCRLRRPLCEGIKNSGGKHTENQREHPRKEAAQVPAPEHGQTAGG